MPRLIRIALLALASVLPAAMLTAQAATQRPAITGIAYVRFAVADQAAENAFFAKLGYQPESVGSDTAVFYLGDTMRQHIDTVVGAPVQLPAGPSRLLAIGLQTSSLSQMQKYLAAKGVSVGEPANHRLTVHDPEGNTIEFTDVVPHTTAQGALRTTLDTRAISHRIIHAGFVTQSQANEDRFYRDILNFHPMWHGGMHDDVTDWSSMQVPEGTDWIEYMLRTRPDASAATRGVLNHVSLGVQNMPATVAKLKENGCDTKECAASQMGRDGKVQLNLYDPDHTRFEVMEFTPTGTVCCAPYTGKMPSAADPL